MTVNAEHESTVSDALAKLEALGISHDAARAFVAGAELASMSTVHPPGDLVREATNNLMGKPEKIKAIRLVAVDYSNIELRVLAHHAAIPDDANPPPGWSRYTITDEDGSQHESLHVRRDEPQTLTVQEAWSQHVGDGWSQCVGGGVEHPDVLDLRARALEDAREIIAVKPMRVLLVTEQGPGFVTDREARLAQAMLDVWGGQ